MLEQTLDLASYYPNPHAIPTFLVALAILALGYQVLVRERSSRVAVYYFLFSLTLVVWLLGISLMYCTEIAEVAAFWAKFEHVGVHLIPAAVYQLTVGVLGMSRRHRIAASASWVVAMGFVVAGLGGDALAGNVTSHPWGFYPQYGWANVPYLAFFFGVMVVSLLSYWRAYLEALPGTIRQRRAVEFLFAFSIGYLGSVDYLPAFGIPVYPFGYLPIMVFLVLLARAIWRYHLVDLTPEMAATQILETMSGALFVLDPDGVIRVANRAATELFGAPEPGLVGKRLAQVLPDADLESLLKAGPVSQHEVTFQPQDGEPRLLTLSTSIMSDYSGQAIGVVCAADDITERRRAETALQQAEQQFRRLVEASPTAIGVHQNGTLVYVNPAGLRLIGATTPHELLGRNVLQFVHPDYRAAAAERARLVMEGQQAEIAEQRWIRLDGQAIDVEVTSIPMVYEGVPSGQIIARDITERKRAEERLTRQAMHDALTDLPNRSLLSDRLAQAVARSQRDQSVFSLFVMDLDHFKEVNDTLGHHAGDLLLQEIAQRIRHTLRAPDTVARLGGDEFAVILPGTDAAGASLIATRLLQVLDQQVVIHGHNVTVGGSIGIAVYPDHGTDPDTLLRRADVAMYVAKRGRSGSALYEPQHDQHSPDRLELMGELRHAIERNQLVLYYQPKLDMRTGRFSGAEALVRWRHPEQGLVPPDVFIPLAEQTGVIRQLAIWTLRTAVQQCRSWRESGIDVTVAVNLSARNLQDPQLPRQVAGILQSYELLPPYLELEITESAIMNDPGRAMEVLTELSEMGVRLSIDDFGTGYSSLAYLKKLPVHQLKVDKSFVKEMAVDENDAAIVRSTVDLGHNLGLKVVAEGVEDQTSLDLLADLGCDVAQGYYLGRPIPADEAINCLSAPPAVRLPVRV